MKMDLHDFKDVAENYDLYVDILQPEDGPLSEKSCVDFHIELAEKYGDEGVIDIGCGTGCTLLPLVKHGYDVVGLDISQSMLDVLQNKLLEGNLKTQLTRSNMSQFSYNKKFSLAIIPRSGFIHLLTKEEQRETLINIYNHLTEGGVLSLNTAYPNLDMLSKSARSENNIFLRTEYKNNKGNIEKIYSDVKYDFETQISKGKYIFEEYNDNGQICAIRECPIAVRCTYKSEIEYLFELCGFKIIGTYGGYDKREAKYPGYLVWVLKKE
jgi:ubiquinone/menaquinone biosynthesis C-methylase UbiE